MTESTSKNRYTLNEDGTVSLYVYYHLFEDTVKYDLSREEFEAIKDSHVFDDTGKPYLDQADKK